MPGQKRKNEEINEDEYSSFTPLVETIISVDESLLQQMVKNESNENTDIFLELAEELGVEPVGNIPPLNLVLDKTIDNQKIEAMTNSSVNLTEEREAKTTGLEAVLGLIPDSQNGATNISTIFRLCKLLKNDRSLANNFYFKQLVATIKTLETSLDLCHFQPHEHVNVKNDLIKFYENLNIELNKDLDATHFNNDNWNVKFELICTIQKRKQILLAVESNADVTVKNFSSHPTPSEIYSEDLAAENQASSKLMTCEEEIELRKEISALQGPISKESFEKIIYHSKNLLSCLRGTQLVDLSLQLSESVSYEWQADLFAKALHLNINSRILHEWVLDNHRLITLLINHKQSKKQGILILNSLYTYIMGFTNKPLQDSDKQFLHYLTDMVPEAPFLMEARSHLESLLKRNNTAPCLARINDLLSNISHKASIPTDNGPLSNVRVSSLQSLHLNTNSNSKSNVNTNNQSLTGPLITLSMNNEQWSLLRLSERKLIQTTRKEMIEKEFARNPNMIHWMRSTMIILSPTEFRNILPSTCLEIFKKMLKLKVKSSIIESVLMHNSRLIGLLNEKCGLETYIVDYILAMGKDDFTNKFERTFLQAITNRNLLDFMLQYCESLEKSIKYLFSDKIPQLTCIKDLIIEHKRKLQATHDANQKNIFISPTVRQPSVAKPANVNQESTEISNANPSIIQQNKCAEYFTFFTGDVTNTSSKEVTSLSSENRPNSPTHVKPFALFNFQADAQRTLAPKLLEIDQKALKKCVDVLRSTRVLNEFEMSWSSNPLMLALMRGNRIYESHSSFHALPKSVCFEIFVNMLQLKVASSIIKAVLDSNPELITRINEPDALRHYLIISYVLSQPFNDQGPLAQFFVTHLSNLTVLKNMANSCLLAEKQNQQDPKKISVINYFQGIITNKITQIEIQLRSKYKP